MNGTDAGTIIVDDVVVLLTSIVLAGLVLAWGVMRMGRVAGSFRKQIILGSVDTMFRAKGAGLVVKQDNSKGAILVGGVVKLVHPSSKRVLCSNHSLASVSGRRLGVLHHRVNVLFRKSTLFSDVAILRGIVFPLSVFSGSACGSHLGHTRFYLSHIGLSRTNRLCPSRVDNNVVGHTTVTHTVTLGPGCLFYSRPGSNLSPGASLVVSSLVRSVATRCGVAAVVGARSVGSIVGVNRGVVFVGRNMGR